MGILKKIRDINKDIRIIKLSLPDVKEFADRYFRSIGWVFNREVQRTNEIFLSCRPDATFRDRFLPTKKPQIVNLHGIQEGNSCKIEIEFGLTRKFKVHFYSILVSLLFIILISLSLLSNKTTGIISPILYPVSFIALLFSSIGMFLFIQRFTDLKDYDALKKAFYEGIRASTGERENILLEGLNFPILIDAFIIILLFCVPVFMIASGLTTRIAMPHVLKALVFFVLMAICFLILIIIRRGLGLKIRLGLFGLTMGISFSIYSLFPLLTVSISSCFSDISNLALHPLSSQLSANNTVNITLWFGVAMIFLLHAAVFLIAWLCFIEGFGMVGKLVSMAKDRSEDSRSAFQQAFEDDAYSRVFSILIFLMWVLCSVATIAGFYFSLAGIEYGLTGMNVFFSSGIMEMVKHNLRILYSFCSALSGKNIHTELILRIELFLYAIPLVSVFIISIVRWAAELARINRWRGSRLCSDVKYIVRELAGYFKTRQPVIAVSDETVISGNVKYVFPLGVVLQISRSAVEMLKKDELRAMIAHEMAHIQRHSLIYSALDFLSEWSFFGKGFLSVVTNSRRFEFEADRIACEYLEKSGQGKSLLISALRKTMVANAMFNYLAYSNSMMAFAKEGIDEISGEVSFYKRLKLCYALYFGDLMLSYVHPSTEERIKKIEEA